MSDIISIKCICNTSHCGEICPMCGLPRSGVLYYARTGPLLPFIIMASMGMVYAYLYYGVGQSPVVKYSTQIFPQLEGALYGGRGDATVVNPSPSDFSPGDKPPAGADVSSSDTIPISSGGAVSTDAGVLRSDPIDEHAASDAEDNLWEDSSDDNLSDDAQIGLKGMSPRELSEKTSQILHLLAGEFAQGQDLSSMFTPIVLNLGSNRETKREAIADSIDNFLSDYPVRGVKLISVGVKGLRLEINTARVFVDCLGDKLRVYGKTVVLLDSDYRITGISDITQEAQTELSPGFTPIPYNLKKTISIQPKK